MSIPISPCSTDCRLISSRIESDTNRARFVEEVSSIFDAHKTMSKGEFISFLVDEFNIYTLVVVIEESNLPLPSRMALENIVENIWIDLSDLHFNPNIDLDGGYDGYRSIFDAMGICFRGGYVPCNFIVCIVLRKMFGEQFYFEIISGKIIVKKTLTCGGSRYRSLRSIALG